MRHNLLLAALLMSLLSACATQPRWARYELCFGLTADAGQTKISDQDWGRFRDEEIVTRFPDGFTLFDAHGSWRCDGKTYSEPSVVLMVVAPDNEATHRKLSEIAKAYKQEFRQESVLEIESPAKIDFHDGE